MITERTRQRFPELATYVEATPHRDRWLVLTHDNPDPDALVAAAILARILSRRFHRDATMAYGGLIGRAENREMVRALALEPRHLRSLDFGRFQRFALVDAQPDAGNHQLPASVTADVVIDHHPLRKATQACPFFDVRPEYGATATILAEYLEASGVEIPHSLATGLVYAIRTETREFGREFAGPDKTVYDGLFPRARKRLLSRIQNASQSLAYFKNLHQALENLESVDTLVVSHLGEVEQPDIVPEIADLLLRMEGKTWSLATGVYGDRVYLSIRTTNPRANAGAIMRRLVARRGKGGGHGMTAGGWVTVAKAPGGDPRALQRQLAEKLARALDKKPEKLAPLILEA